MSNNETLKRDIRRQKRKTLPPEPQDLASINLQLPHTFSLEAIPTVFLQYDCGPQAGDGRVLIFGGNNCLRHLATSRVCHVDGNFSMAPNIFVQIYVIRAPLDSSAISCAYILLPGKTEGMYTEMLREMVNACRGLGLNSTPQTIVMDFEKTAINAARNVLGVNDITGCYFHFCGSVWKRIQKLGLTNLYNNAQVKLFVGMCIALAFLPLVNQVIVNAF